MISQNGADCVPAELRIATDAAMRDLGREVAARLRAGDLVILTGPLGRARPPWCRASARDWGCAAGHLADLRHRAGPPGAGRSGPSLVHADAYRLGSISEVDDLDLDADVASAVTVVEWGEGRPKASRPTAWWSRSSPTRTARPGPYGCAVSGLAGTRGYPENSRPAAQIVYSSAVLRSPVRLSRRLRTIFLFRRRTVPEQEFLPPRFHRPDGPAGFPDEEQPPWANLPPIRPARPAARMNHHGDPGRPPGPPAAARPGRAGPASGRAPPAALAGHDHRPGGRGRGSDRGGGGAGRPCCRRRSSPAG